MSDEQHHQPQPQPADQRPQLAISGERAALGPLRADLLPLYQRWVNDREGARGIGQLRVHTLEGERAWLDERLKNDPARADFTVYDRGDLAPVGTTSLFRINPDWGTATFGIIIGERRGQGIGTDAARLTLEWGFTVLGLYNIDLGVFAWNTRAVRTYEKAGFREIGRRRGACVTMGRRYDEILMDAVADQFEGTALAHLVPDGGRPLH